MSTLGQKRRFDQVTEHFRSSPISRHFHESSGRLSYQTYREPRPGLSRVFVFRACGQIAMTRRRPSQRLRAKTNSLNRINAIPPVQSLSLKIFRFAIPPNQIHNCRVPSRSRGVSRSSRTLVTGCDGRESGAGRAQLMRTAKSCGPGAPMQALRLRDTTRRRRWQPSMVTGEITCKP